MHPLAIFPSLSLSPPTYTARIPLLPPAPALIGHYGTSKAYEENSYPYNYSLSLPKISKLSASISKGLGAEDVYGEELRKQERHEKVPAVESKILPVGLKAELMPKHLAMIMDGNRRWAVKRDLPVMVGHDAGRKALKALIRLCCQFGIKIVTIFAFSTENWTRAIEEVDFLMDLFEDMMRSEMEERMGLGIRASVIGNRSTVPRSLREIIARAEETTKANSGTQVNYAINYSGKYDITQACKSIANKVQDGVILPNDIEQNMFEQELETKHVEFPCPDLLIRTSGELRLSNFMMWQLAHSELYFSQKLFPDFGEDDLIEALNWFQKRCKR